MLMMAANPNMMMGMIDHH